MKSFNDNWDGVKRSTLSEKYYAKGMAKDEVQHILPKWVYEQFFKRLKAKGKNFLFNQVKAEAALENIFNLSLNPRSPFSRIRDYGQMYVEAEADYMKKMGLEENAKEIGEEFTQQTAQTIKQQLGGGRFVAMTGAKDFMYSGKDSYLSFKIGKGAKDGINYIKIIYNQGKDDYTVEFCVFRGTNVTVKHRVEGVYADQLREIFEKHTGLYTSLR